MPIWQFIFKNSVFFRSAHVHFGRLLPSGYRGPAFNLKRAGLAVSLAESRRN